MAQIKITELETTSDLGFDGQIIRIAFDFTLEWKGFTKTLKASAVLKEPKQSAFVSLDELTESVVESWITSNDIKQQTTTAKHQITEDVLSVEQKLPWDK
jgi:hypothetical protein